MASNLLPHSLLIFSFLLVLHTSRARAQDGGGVPPGAAQPTTVAGENAAGASGSTAGAINLSSGSTIAIAVVVSVIVVLGITSTVLWFIAKKRQWRVRDTIRSSVRRVGSAITSPLTPRTPRGGSKMTFPQPAHPKPTKPAKPIKISANQGSKVVKLHDPVPHALKGRVNNNSVDMTERPSGHKHSSSFEYRGDEEKDLARPAVTRLDIPQSSFDMDSPGSAQLSVWSKIFGRK